MERQGSLELHPKSRLHPVPTLTPPAHKPDSVIAQSFPDLSNKYGSLSVQDSIVKNLKIKGGGGEHPQKWPWGVATLGLNTWGSHMGTSFPSANVESPLGMTSSSPQVWAATSHPGLGTKEA